jgi:hypothetical protein
LRAPRAGLAEAAPVGVVVALMGLRGRSECGGEVVAPVWLRRTRSAACGGWLGFLALLAACFEKQAATLVDFRSPSGHWTQQVPATGSTALPGSRRSPRPLAAAALLSVSGSTARATGKTPVVRAARPPAKGREVPPSRREPAHDVSTPAASRCAAAIGTTRTEARADAPEAGAPETKPNARVER